VKNSTLFVSSFKNFVPVLLDITLGRLGVVVVVDETGVVEVAGVTRAVDGDDLDVVKRSGVCALGPML
jgi:hypothetical protein